MPSKPETRLQELHLTLPTPPKPVAKYKTAVLVGNMLYVSGHGPAKIDGQVADRRQGRQRPDHGAGQGSGPARSASTSWPRCATPSARSTRSSAWSRRSGMVNCTADFKDQPQVINGFSELMAEVFGEDAGVGARSAVGMGVAAGQHPGGDRVHL